VLSLQVLHWLVRHLLSAGTTAAAEELLGQYCISRRDPLSTVAAVKEAIMQVRHGCICC
jgi:G3E family GTPase